MKTKFTLSNGNEVLLGLNIYNSWCVSCWDDDYNCLWSKDFPDENLAREYFDKIKIEIDGLGS